MNLNEFNVDHLHLSMNWFSFDLWVIFRFNAQVII